MNFEQFCRMMGFQLTGMDSETRKGLEAAFRNFNARNVQINTQDFCRSFRVAPATFNAEKRSVRADVLTDAPTWIWDWEYGVVREVLPMDAVRMPQQMPLCDTHDTSTTRSVFGSCRNMLAESRNGLTALSAELFFAQDQASFDAMRKVQDGHITDLSGGYRVYKAVFIKENEKFIFNGRTYDGPLKLALDWEPTEGSLCAVGADQFAKIRSAHKQTPTDKPVTNSAQGAGKVSQEERTKMKMTFTQFCRNIGKDASALTEHERAALEIVFDAYCKELDAAAEVPAEAKERAAKIFAGFDAAKKAGTAEELQRQQAIEEVCLLASYPEDMARKLIADPAMTQARAFDAVKAWKKEQTTPVPQARASEIQLGTNRAIDHVRSAGARGLALTFDNSLKVDKNDGVESFRSGGKERVMRELLRAHGIDTSMMGSKEVIDAVFSRSFVLADFANITADAANIKFESDVAAAETVYQLCAKIGSVDSFKKQYRARLMDSGSMEEVDESGEYKILKLDDEGSYIQVKEHGISVPMSRKLMLDNALDIKVEAASRVIVKTQLDIEAALFGLLINNKMYDGSQIFTSARKNIGTAAALSAPSLDEARMLMAAIKGDNDQAMGLRPKFILTGAKYARVAAELCTSASAPDADHAGVTNYYKNLTPLETFTITDGKWFALGNPALEPHLEAAFYNGQRIPKARVTERSGGSGIVMDINLDWGVACHSWRNMIKNAGA